MHQRRGFTLTEVIITMAIIALLTLIAAGSFSKARAKSKLARLSTELSDIVTATSQFANDNNSTYPVDTSRNVPPGLEKYLAGGTWPKSIWPKGVFDWDNWVNGSGSQIYQITYRLCDITDPIEDCSDPVLFPNFTRNSGIYYCMQGSCVPHRDYPTDPGYCVNCKPKEVNY